MPQIPSLAALNNAQLLKQSPSSANMANYSDIFDGPAEGHVPTAWEQFSGDRNADMAETALGAGPAIDALRHVAENAQLQKASDASADASDYFAHGLDRGMTRATTENQIGDVVSEGRARRGFLPWAQQQHEQQFGDTLMQSDARYGEPARAKAFGDVQSAQIGAQGRVQAAQASHGSPVEALQKALLELIQQGKTPEQIQGMLPGLQQVYGVQ